MIFTFFPLGYFLYYKYHTAKLETKSGVFIASLIFFAVALPFNIPNIFLIYIPFFIYIGLIDKQRKAAKKNCVDSFQKPASSKPYSYETSNDNRYEEKLSYINNLHNVPQDNTIDKLWVPFENNITFYNYIIPNGMIYYGHLYNEANAALIDPHLPILQNYNDYKNTRMGYWPSYDSISPEARGCYLAWLANGKKDPEADIGYVFLYFYGLEQRLLQDIPAKSALHDEVKIIKTEINRLLAIYGGNNSFHTYATSLLSYIDAENYVNNIVYHQPAPAPTYNQGVPSLLRLAIAQMSRDQIPLPADWALNWYLSTYDPPTYSRTAAQRCYAEFKELFTQKYQKKFADGIKIKPNKTTLSFEYYPASASLNNKTYIKQTDLPDITSTKATLNRLAPLIQECHDELDKYSRFLGRNPDKKDTLDAMLELPSSIYPKELLLKINQITADIQGNNNLLTLSFSELINHLLPWENRSKNKVIMFLNILENKFNICMEPDCRINGKVPTETTMITVFEQYFPLSLDYFTNAVYSFATLTLHLNILVSQADGTIQKEEKDILMNKIDKWSWLDEKAKPRLKAHAEYLFAQDVKIAGVKKRLEELDHSQKELIGSILVQTAKADGTVSVEEVKLLEKLFKLLGIDTSVLYNQINQSEFEPVTVAINTQNSNDFMIKQPPKPENPSKIHINFDKLVALKADSEKVSGILTEIFNNYEEESKIIPLKTIQNDKCLWNLSAELSKFVYLLITKQQWSLPELEDIAVKHQLMLEGSLEEINEAAYDNFDEPLLEEIDKGFEINQDIVEEIEK